MNIPEFLTAAHGDKTLNPQVVLDTITKAINSSSQVNREALELIQQWERDTVPGFLTSLKEIVQHKQISEEIRLVAAILAKNTVGNSWRKTVDTREWFRVPEEEKNHLKENLISILLNESSDRIVQQIVLLIANIARFDYPQKWPNLVEELLNILSSSSTYTIDNKLKAALGLKQTLSALRTKVTVSNSLNMYAVKLAMEEAKVMPNTIAALFPRLSAELFHYISSFRIDDNFCYFNGKIAKFLVSSSHYALELLQQLKSVPNIKDYYEKLYFYSNSQFQLLYQTLPLNPPPTTSFPIDYLILQSDLYFKIINCLKLSLEKHTFEFSEFLVPFVKNYTLVFTAISTKNILNEQLVRRLFTPEKLMKIIQFLTKVLVCPILQEKFWKQADYLHSFTQLQFLPSFSLAMEANDSEDMQKSKETYTTLSQFFTSDQMTPLLYAIVSKYMTLTKEELEDWENDPETFIKEIEAQDTLRQASEELLVALSVYNPLTVENIINSIVDQLKALPPASFSTIGDNILNLDACYKSIALTSVVVTRSNKNSMIHEINNWYSSELKNRIEQSASATQIQDKILLFRSLWIIRKLAFKLEDSNRLELLKSAGLLGCLYSNDIVISLQAIITIHSLLTAHKEYTFFHNLDLVDREEKNSNQSGVDEVAASFSSKFPTIKPTYLPTTQHLPIGDIIKGSFILLPKLTETESRLQILHLVINLLKIVGKEEVVANVPVVLQHLPQLWESLSTSTTEESGSEIRLKKELITLISTIVITVSSSLYDLPNLFDIAITTLKQATDYNVLVNTDVLPKSYIAMSAEEGFTLWIAILRNSQTLSQPLIDLLPILLRMIKNNIEVITGFQVLEAYILLGGSAVMTACGAQIFTTLNSFLVNCQSEKSHIVHAVYCLETILRMFPVEGTLLFKPTIQFLSMTLYEKALNNTAGENSFPFSDDVISKFAQIISRVIVQNQNQFIELITPISSVQTNTFLNNILQIFVYEIQLHSINELFSLMLSITSARNRKILGLAILVIILQLHESPVEYFSQCIISIFDIIRQMKRTEERRKIYSQQFNRIHKSKLDEMFYEISENDPLYTIDIVSYFQKACQLYITRFGSAKLFHLFSNELHPELDRLISATDEDSLSLTSLTV